MRVVAVFSCNQLMSLPDFFGNLTKLTKLYVGCVIRHVACTTRALRNCSNNQLSSLPLSIGNLPRLTVLNVTCVPNVVVVVQHATTYESLTRQV